MASESAKAEPRKPAKEKNLKKIIPGNLLDYVVWRGDLTFDLAPWNEIDSAIASVFSYANLGENELVFGCGRELRVSDLAETDLLERIPQEGMGNAADLRNQLLSEMGRSARYRDIRVLDQVNDVDPGRNIQFSALTMVVSGVGAVVVYRGTDLNLVGWKEDFMLSYATPVPAQTAALAYLKKAAGYTEGPLFLVGHSKGGNLALYTAVHTVPKLRARIQGIWSFDGPGLDDGTIASESYRKIRPLIHSFIPSGSIIGLLMNYHPVYRVVESSAKSIMQHDPLSWQLLGKSFMETDSLSKGSRIMDQTLHEWLSSCSPEQREVFTTALFTFLEKKQKKANSSRTVEETEEQLEKADDVSKKMIRSVLYKLVSIHAGVSWDTNVVRPLAQAAESLREMLRGTSENTLKSNVIRIDNRGNGFSSAVEETQSIAEFNGLDRKNSLRLALFTEEMLSLVRTITGQMEAEFWLECEDQHYELCMTTSTVTDKKVRKELLASSSSGRNDASRSFLGRLRSAFESARAAKDDGLCFDLSGGSWDGYERSVLLRLADNVRIAIRGGKVRMTVSKTFTLPVPPSA